MFYTCPCTSRRHGYGTIFPRHVMQFVRVANYERASREYVYSCTHTYVPTYVYARGGWTFFRRPLEDQAPFIKCSLDDEGVERARCQNFQQFFIPLFAETNENEIDLCNPNVRNVAHACTQPKGRSSNKWNEGADAHLLFNSGAFRGQ